MQEMSKGPLSLNEEVIFLSEDAFEVVYELCEADKAHQFFVF